MRPMAAPMMIEFVTVDALPIFWLFLSRDGKLKVRWSNLRGCGDEPVRDELQLSFHSLSVVVCCSENRR